MQGIGIMKAIQITDTHLFADDELEIFGVKSNQTFKNVIDRIINDDMHNADMIFLTGDISQDETTESYQKIIGHLSQINIPVYWIPGNHDNLGLMAASFQKAKHFIRGRQLTSNNWHLIFLNTKIEGREDGYLAQSELTMLRKEISKCTPNKKIAIIMHHHPAPVGTPLIDNYILANANDFWEIVTGKNIEVIICGHVHGDYQFTFNGIQIESSPATCLQWEKGTKDLKIDKKIGYKVYHFNSDGYESSAKTW
jgi:Icc protein